MKPVRLYEELAQYGCNVKTIRGTRLLTGLPRNESEVSDVDDLDD